MEKGKGMIGTQSLDKRPGWTRAAVGTVETGRSPSEACAVPCPPESETSFQLLVRARTGDRDALERLCALYLPRLHRWTRGRLPPGARGALDTGDVVQEVLMKALARLEMFEPRAAWSFQKYLRNALKHRLIDLARHARRHPAPDALDSSSPTEEQSPLEMLIGAEGIERYEAALQRLRPTDQRAIVARCEWGMSYIQVADLLGKPNVNATRVAIHRALVRLAQEMANDRRAHHPR
jgi:RNA polymerase sigma-70 factor, ECF subfamily